MTNEYPQCTLTPDEPWLSLHSTQSGPACTPLRFMPSATLYLIVDAAVQSGIWGVDSACSCAIPPAYLLLLRSTFITLSGRSTVGALQVALANAWGPEWKRRLAYEVVLEKA